MYIYFYMFVCCLLAADFCRTSTRGRVLRTIEGRTCVPREAPALERTGHRPKTAQWTYYMYMVKRSKRDLPASPAWSRKGTHFGVECNHIVWHPFFNIVLDLGSVLSSILSKFSIILPSFFDHRFRIDFSSIREWIVVSLLMFF